MKPEQVQTQILEQLEIDVSPEDLAARIKTSRNDQKIQEIALTIGLNLEDYDKRKKDPAIQQMVNQDLLDGQQAGVRGTPTIFINGIRLRDRSLKGFQAAIDKQLQKHSKTATKPSS